MTRARDKAADLADGPPAGDRANRSGDRARAALDGSGSGSSPVTERPLNHRRDGAGPYDSDDSDVGDVVGGLDFGALRVPMPARAQLQVEQGSGDLLRAVHVLVPTGRVSLSALAAPRSSPLWRSLAQEIAGSLGNDGARVWAEWGPWGREVMAGSKGALSRFVGVDGPRWMLYGVATGPEDGAEELAETLREMIRATVVTRGADPLPVKTVLPLRLPEHLEERVEQARDSSARRPAAESATAADPRTPEPAAGPRTVEPAAGPDPGGPDAEPERVQPAAAASDRTGPDTAAPDGIAAVEARPVADPGRRRPVGGPPAVSTPAGGIARSIGIRPVTGPVRPAASTGAYPAVGPGRAARPAAAADPGWPVEPAAAADPGWPAEPATGPLPRLPGGGPVRHPQALPPVPALSEMDTGGLPRVPGVEATWSLARPVVSADQVAQQPAWALLSEAPTFWPQRPAPVRPPSRHSGPVRAGPRHGEPVADRYPTGDWPADPAATLPPVGRHPAGPDRPEPAPGGDRRTDPPRSAGAFPPGPPTRATGRPPGAAAGTAPRAGGDPFQAALTQDWVGTGDRSAHRGRRARRRTTGHPGADPAATDPGHRAPDASWRPGRPGSHREPEPTGSGEIAGDDGRRERRQGMPGTDRPDRSADPFAPGPRGAGAPDPARWGPARHDSARHDSARHDSARHDSARHRSDRFGSDRFGSDRPGPGPDRPRPDPARSGSADVDPLGPDPLGVGPLGGDPPPGWPPGGAGTRPRSSPELGDPDPRHPRRRW